MVTKNTKLLAALLLAVTLVGLIWQSRKTHYTSQTANSFTDVAVSESDLLSPELNLNTPTLVEGVDASHAVNTLLEVDVAGRVIDRSSHSISGLQIEISSKNTSVGQQNIYTATTDTNGEFIIHALPPSNEYRLEVLASGAYAGLVLDSLQVKSNMDPITITLESIELVSVDGMIVDVDNSPVADFEILVRNIDMAYPGSRIVSDSSGFFQLNEFPAGDLQLSTSGDEHFKINGISLQPGEYQNLTIILDKGSYHFSGWVSDGLGAPISQARVVMTSLLTHEGIQSSSYRFRLTDNYGGFEFSGLGGHEHQLVIDAMGYEPHIANYHFKSISDNLSVELNRL